MNIRPITLRVNFNKNSKKTFSRKAKNTTSSMVRKYYKSLDSEARARLEYIKFKKAEDELFDIPNDYSIKNILKAVKTLLKLGNHKLNSVVHQTDAFHYFPERFYEADNPKAFPERHYKLPSSITMPWE